MVPKNMTIKNKTIREAMKKLNLNSKQILFYIDDKKELLGTLTDGDIRRALLSDYDLNDKIDKVVNLSPIKISISNKDKISEIFKINKHVDIIPVVDENNKLVGYKSRFESEMINSKQKKIETPVVIMAGGKGTRLYPFTNILPKPMFPINEKPIVQIIMDKFIEQGFYKFYLIVNYKKEIIKSYFNDLNYNIDFIDEEDFLGTAGGLHLLKNKINSDFILTNSDILLEINYLKLLESHKKNNSQITIVGANEEHQIPYGVLKTNENGELLEFKEKPINNYIINTGVYVINNDVLNLLDGSFLGMNELIEKVNRDNKVHVYPIFNKWFDIGQWSEYKETLNHFEQLEE